MKSVRLHGTANLQTRDKPIPMPGIGEKLIRNKSVGIYRSDLHWFSEGEISDAKLGHPLVLGHEFARETENGRRVAIDSTIPADTVNFVNMVIPIYARTWPLQSAIY